MAKPTIAAKDRTSSTGAADDERCAEVLLDVMDGRAGLVGAELNTSRGELTLSYDPTVLPAHEADDLAARLSQQLDHRYQVCANAAAGITCDECSRSLQEGLDQRGNGAHTRFTVRPGLVALQSSAPPIVLAEVRKALHPPQTDEAAPRWPWQRWDATRWEVTLTVITGLATATAWIGSAFGLPVTWQTGLYMLAYLAGGYFGVREGLAELRRGAINIDLLMVLAAIGAAAIGSWREGAILLFLFSLSNTLQGYAMGRSRRAIQALMQLRPDEALVKRAYGEVRVRIEQIQPGDVVIVKPGDRLPVDGVVQQGQSSVDQSTITGESVPVDVQPGAPVYAGTVNQTGALEVEVTRLASESTLARIIELVENAQEEKAPTQRFLDEFEQKYALGVILATLLAIAIPYFVLNQPFDDVFYRAMTLLVVASPCALVISVPAAVLSGIANAARRGILFKGGAYLENLGGVKAIAFDKTGTLTRGKPVVTDLRPLGCCDENELLALAAAAEARSEHPLAKAIVAEARRRGLDFEPCRSLEAITGRGARAESEDGRVYLIGNQDLFEGRMALPDEALAALEALESQGKTAMLLGEERAEGVTLFGLLAVADELRPETAAAIQALRQQGIEHMIMLTGDNARVAGSIARQAGVDEYRAGLLPQDKVEAIKALGGQYGLAAMVGDGVNDAPAMAAAGVGIAMGAAGSDVALETADVVLMADDLSKLAYVVNLSKRARRIIWQNIIFALGVIVVLVISNFLVGVPLPLGVVAHEGSTLIVVANGLRLLR